MSRNEEGSRLRCVLTYHEMQEGSSKYLYRVSTEQFSEHLAFVSSLPRINLGTRAPEIVFDDGHKSNFEEAFPILEEHGNKATFFVVAGRIGNDKEFMNWGQLRQLVSAGHRVESHGWAHRILTSCSENDLKQELVSSKEELENRLGTGVVAISAPGGRWNEKVLAASVKAGYRQFFHSNPWRPARMNEAIQVQGRHMVTGQMGVDALAKLQEMSPQQVFLQRTKCGLKENVRAALGDRLYHKLWSKLANWEEDEGIQLDVGDTEKTQGAMRHS